jgi:hypothetical protein
MSGLGLLVPDACELGFSVVIVQGCAAAQAGHAPGTNGHNRRRKTDPMFLILIAIGWLYVALMMAAAEASSPVGSVLGAIITFFLYGVGPVSLLLYILATPARKRRRRQREAEELLAWQQAQAAQPPSAQPDAGGQAAADAVAPVRKET